MSRRREILDDYITVGAHVRIRKDGRTGLVKFVGPVHFMPGVAIGIDLDQQYEGTSDGTVDGWNYFDADRDRAVFVRKADIVYIEEDDDGDDMEYEPSQSPSFNDSIISDGYKGDPAYSTGFGHTRGEPEHFGSPPMVRRDSATGNGYDDHIPKFDDQPERHIRGMSNALEDDLLDFKSDPNKHSPIVIYFAMDGTDVNEIKHLPKYRVSNAICRALPKDMREEINPNQLKITQKELDDYTEMRVEFEADDPEQADDLKWTVLDPRYVKRFNNHLQNDQEMDHMTCRITYLERKNTGCCRWVRPCLCCCCWWALILSIIIPWFWAKMMKISDDVELLKQERDDAFADAMMPHVDCSASFDKPICEQIREDMDALDRLEDQATKDSAAIEAAQSNVDTRPNNERYRVATKVEVVSDRISTAGSGLARCPNGDYELLNCWVHLPDNWDLFDTFVDPDRAGFPDCTCYCQHESDDRGCNKNGAQCKAQCVLFSLEENPKS